MGINIKRYGDVLTHLNIKLLDAVFTKDTEQTLAGILSRDFNDIVLRHPRVTRSLRDTTTCRQNGNDFS